VYPLAKRVTNWPQVVLGMTFNTGVLMGYTAAQNNQLGYLDFPWLDPTFMSLYAAGISWTLIYDTIYAYQDLEDDSTLGLGSTARRFGDDAKLWLSGFSAVMISSLATTGYLAELSWPYYAGIAAVASHLTWQVIGFIESSTKIHFIFQYPIHPKTSRFNFMPYIYLLYRLKP
jgi:4-hydroxybenzoate polyprenyltransferase